MSSSYNKKDMENKKVAELLKICKKLNISKCSGLKKEELINKIVKESKALNKKRSSEKRRSSSRKRSKESMESKKDFDKMKVDELKKYMKKEKIKLPSYGSGKNEAVLKSDLIREIMDHISRKSEVEYIEIPSSKSPKKSSPRISPVFEYKCGDKKNSCSPKACSVKTGECIPVLKTGKLHKSSEKKQREVYGEDYYFDEKTGLIGPKEDIEKHIQSWKEEESEQRCDSKENPKSCGQDELCDSSTGDCIDDNDQNRKDKYILDTNGRLIVGSKYTIEKLQKILGGDISPAEEEEVETSSSHENQKDVQDRIDKLLIENGNEYEIRELQERLEKMQEEHSQGKSSSRSKSSSPPQRTTSSLKLGLVQQDIYKLFSDCLSDMK